MKKVVAALSCAVLLIAGCLSGCNSERTVLSVGAAEIGSEVYLYYMNQAFNELSAQADAEGTTEPETGASAEEAAIPATDATEPESAEPASAAVSTEDTTQAASGATPTAQELYSRANELCAEYVAVNTLFRDYDCSLTPAEKSSVSAMTNDLWRLYGNYYESIGVSKQTLYKIQLNDAYRDAVLNALYGEEGLDPVPEEELRQYYEDHHIVFRAISGYYTNVDENGNTVPMSEEERAAMDSAFNNMAERINGDTDMDTVYNDYLESLGDGEASETVEIRVATDESAGYPEGFFEAVHAMEQDTASVVRLGDYIYVIVRLDPYTEESAYYQARKTDALRGLKAGEFEELVQTTAAGYTLTPEESAQRRCLKKLQEQHDNLTLE